jgi:hypothetical protein
MVLHLFIFGEHLRFQQNQYHTKPSTTMKASIGPEASVTAALKANILAQHV